MTRPGGGVRRGCRISWLSSDDARPSNHMLVTQRNRVQVPGVGNALSYWLDVKALVRGARQRVVRKQEFRKRPRLTCRRVSEGDFLPLEVVEPLARLGAIVN